MERALTLLSRGAYLTRTCLQFWSIIVKYLTSGIHLFAIQVLLCAGTARGDVIAAWHFDELAGLTAFAAAGSVDGALMGDASFLAGGISGGAVNMTTGGNGLVDMGNNFSFDGNSTFSIVAWFQLNNGDSNGYMIAGRHQSTVAAGYFLSVNDIGSASGEVAGGGSFFQSYPNPVSANLGLNDGGWHQVVGVHDFAANQTQLYVDGILRDTKPYNPFAASAANFAVGGIFNPAGTQMVGILTGAADEVSIWDNALNSTQVAYLYNNPGALAVPEPTALAVLNGVAILVFARRRQRSRHSRP